MIARLRKCEKLTDKITNFWFEPEQPYSYLAGQYALVSLNGNDHWYSLSSSPTETLISFATKFTKPISRFKSDLLKLKPGDEIRILTPLGDFVLPVDKTIPLIFVCGGIGITPFRSIVKFLLDNKERRDIQLFYAVDNERELIFESLFKHPKYLNYSPIISHPRSPNLPKSRLTASSILMQSAKDERTLIYISGPQRFVEDINNDLLAKLSPNNIVLDYFEGY